MIPDLLLIAAVPVGVAAVLGFFLWLGRASDRAASAAAGFTDHDQAPYAPIPDDQPGRTFRAALAEPEYLDDLTITHDHRPHGAS